MAEEEGFEPPVPCGTVVFKTTAIDHSAIPPRAKVAEETIRLKHNLHILKETTTPSYSLSLSKVIIMLRKPLFLALFILLLPLSSWSTLRTYLDHKVFYAPGLGTYLEVYVSFDGTTMAYAPTVAGRFQAKVEMTMILKKGEEIVDFKKLEISGPELLENEFVDIIDQQRFAVANGDYELELQFKDLNHPDGQVYSHLEPIHIEVDEEKTFFSDIELVSSFDKSTSPSEMTRSGYDVVPFVSDYYPPEVSQLKFYAELYNSHKIIGQDEMFLITYYLEAYETNEKIADMQIFIRSKAQEVNVVMGNMDISSLRSGNYNLVLEARDKENKLIEQEKLYFVRNNPQHFTLEELDEIQTQLTFVSVIDDRDTIVEYIYSLQPIASAHEKLFVEEQMPAMDLMELKRYFYSFWTNRNSNQPDVAWQKYRSAVKQVDKYYGSRIKKGYETDRGWVHLKYGAPNSLTNEAHEADAYPYQIWHYYKAGKYNNKRFVFYLPDLVTNDYVLLHSEVPGEIHNERWNAIIHSRNTPLNSLDVYRSNSDSGQEVDEQYVLPY